MKVLNFEEYIFKTTFNTGKKRPCVKCGKINVKKNRIDWEDNFSRVASACKNCYYQLLKED